MRKTGSLKFAAATTILVLIAALSFAGTAMSRTGFSDPELEGYYRELEEQLVRDTRAYLNENGFTDSGVTLYRVVEADGSREYTVTVHHWRIDRMAETEREALARALGALTFEGEDCSFSHEFLQ